VRRKIVLSIIIALIAVKFVYSYNPAHLKALMARGLDNYWASWRKKHPHIRPDLSHAVINDLSFGGDFSRVNFKYAKLIDCSIGGADFTGSDFSYSLIKKCYTIVHRLILEASRRFTANRFYEAKIVESNFYGTNFINVSFNEAKLYKSNFDDCSFKKTSFIKAEIVDSTLTIAPVGNNHEFYFVDFSNSYIKKTMIFGRKFNYISFKNAKIIKCLFGFDQSNAVNFTNADLTGSTFLGCNLLNVNFTNANLINTDFSDKPRYDKTTFKNVIFKNADMKGAKINRKWYNYIKRQGVRNFDKIIWVG
jgi:uncharacterized protein YjbI with pentapeptide repeats